MLLTPASVFSNTIQDFSTPSMEGVLARDNLEEDAGGDDHDQLEQYHIVNRRQWEQKYVHCLRMKQCMLLVHSSNGINFESKKLSFVKSNEVFVKLRFQIA